MVDETTYDSSAGLDAPASKPAWDDLPEVAPGRAELVKERLRMLKDSEKHHEKKFKQAREDMFLARKGADKAWVDAGNFVVGVAVRQTNLAVSKLYAKNPQVIAKRTRKLLFNVWDGKAETLQLAVQGAAMGDPIAAQVMTEVKAAQDYMSMVDRVSQSLALLWGHFTSIQEAGFKQQMKAVVRRAKVCSAGYVRLGFQRALEKNPEVTAKIGDMERQISSVQAMLDQMASGDDRYEDESARLTELKFALQTLQDEEETVVSEGPVWGFPKFHSVLIDKNCVHLKTLAGAGWIAYIYDKTREEILKTWNVDVKNAFTARVMPDPQGRYTAGKPNADNKDAKARCYEVWDRESGQVYVVCDGYPDFIVDPAAPKVKLRRFFDLFPLVFNEIEDEEELFPPSDMELMKDSVAEYNRARQGLREHRIANRPRYVGAPGALEEEDQAKLTGAAAHSYIELAGLGPREKIEDKVQPLRLQGIDPNMYQVEESFKDVLRSVGSQEADFGTTSGDTATETSIAAESSRSSNADNVDDLDDMLTEIAKEFGHLCLSELSYETVAEICGPGCAWPRMKPTREDINKDLMLTIKAGSSGRPNAAQEAAKLERVTPMLVQLPGIKPEALARRYGEIIDVPLDELFVDGLPSITALNAAMSRQTGAPQPGTGDPSTDPNAQGVRGGDNAPVASGGTPGAQPAYPAPGEAQEQLA